MDEFTWLIKMLPEGVSVTAVLSVVVLFLRTGAKLLTDHQTQLASMQKEHQETVKAITESHIESQKETRESFTAQLEKVTTTFNDRHDAMQEKVNQLTEAHIKVSTETVAALNGLKDAVRDLQREGK